MYSDMIAAWSVDRLGRSLQDLVAFLGELKSADVDLFLHQQALDTSTPSGRSLFQMLGVFAEFEAAMIRERSTVIRVSIWPKKGSLPTC
jgi:DNA invertase Pin-like site-specific DNA recombinase